MLTIHVRAHGNLRRHFPGGHEEADFRLPEGSRVADLLAHIGLPDGEVWMVGVNDVLAQAEQALADGDKVDVFAPVAGG
ncbi:MAG: MoaD/ThiS family protein [Bacillota bacterium]